MLMSRTNFSIKTNSMDSDQTAPRGAVCSASTLFATLTFRSSLIIVNSVVCYHDQNMSEVHLNMQQT